MNRVKTCDGTICVSLVSFEFSGGIRHYRNIRYRLTRFCIGCNACPIRDNMQPKHGQFFTWRILHQTTSYLRNPYKKLGQLPRFGRRFHVLNVGGWRLELGLQGHLHLRSWS